MSIEPFPPEKREVWGPGFPQWPWSTFQHGLRLDDIMRREHAMDAILAWPDASDALRADAYHELYRTALDTVDWNEDIDKARDEWEPKDGRAQPLAREVHPR